MRIFKTILIGGMLLGLTGCAADRGNADQVCFDQTCFVVEVADTPQERQQGLMYRKSMPQDHGMLFIFAQPYAYSFWMKNTHISLDIIWLDYSRQVIHVEQDVPPCVKEPCPHYEPSGEALYVVELNAGKAAHAGIAVGDRVQFHIKPEKNE